MLNGHVVITQSRRRLKRNLGFTSSKHKTHLCHPGKSVCDGVTAAVWQRASYHGFHRFPALGLRSRQEEIFGISPEIHPQVDVKIHSVTLLCISTCYTRWDSGCLPRTERRFGSILPVRSAVLWLSPLDTPTTHHVSGNEVKLPLGKKNTRLNSTNVNASLK